MVGLSFGRRVRAALTQSATPKAARFGELRERAALIRRAVMLTGLQGRPREWASCHGSTAPLGSELGLARPPDEKTMRA
jgi:hypothetical protein